MPRTREQDREYQKKWREKNPERVSANRARWREQNREKIRASQKARRDADPNLREKQALYREKNRDRRLAYMREYYRKNPHKHYAGRMKAHLKKKYNLTEAEFDQMLSVQNRRCAICGRSKPEVKRMVVDHCHATGVVRKILCDACNRGLGFFGDNPVRIEAAISYLERWKKKHQEQEA